MTNDVRVWVVFEGHGYYFDSVWTEREGAERRAKEIAAREGEDWDTESRRYLRHLEANRALTNDELWGAPS